MSKARLGALEVTVEPSSIVELEPLPQIVVSSDNNYLSHGGSVSKAIWHAAGSALDADVAQLTFPLRLGDVVETTGGALCSRILHVVTLDFDQNLRIRAVEIPALVRSLLLRSDAAGAESIGLPLLGSGKAGVPAELAANAVVAGIASASREDLASLRRVVIATPWENQTTVASSALRNSASRPQLPTLVRHAVEHVPARLGPPMTEALADLATAKRPWALVALTELALRALAAEALAVLAPRHAVDSPPSELLSDLGDPLAKRVLRPDGRLAEELPPGLPLSQFHTAARTLRRHAALDLPGPVDSAIASAITARNQLAHGTGDVSPLLEDALTTVYAFLAKMPSQTQNDVLSSLALSSAVGAGIAGPLGAALGGVLGAVMRPWRPQKRTAKAAALSQQPAAVSREEQTSDDAPVRRLVALLRELLDPERLEDLDQELRELGFAGDPELKLLEYAVRHEDPAGWLSDELPLSVLRQQLTKRSGAKPAPQVTGRALAEQLMELLGFPRVRRIEGIVSATRSIEAARTRVLAASANEIKGLVLEAATTIERIALVLLRFVCMAGFGIPPEIYFRERHPKLIDPDRSLDRATLGTMFSLLEHLAKDFETTDEPRAAVLRKDLQHARLIPKGASSVAQMRNQFAHLRDENVRPPIHELRQRAAAFFSAAFELLEYLGEPEHRVFPRVIRVKEVRIDSWHRRIVEAEDEQGHAEYVFSGRMMMPGEVYYMHPLTNPFRVDPILVEAGDLASASSRTQD